MQSKLADAGYTDLAPGKLANVVTCLEMLEAPPRRPDPPGIAVGLVQVPAPDPRWYRELFARIGGPYLWFSRLALDDAELATILHDPRVEVYAVRGDGEDIGFLELDFRTEGQCWLAYFGLVESAVGKGVGRWLMNRALERAWSQPIERVWVHTCTLDHPNALAFYIRSGFRPYKRQVEVYDDPRLVGLLPRTAAPHVPLI